MITKNVNIVNEPEKLFSVPVRVSQNRGLWVLALLVLLNVFFGIIQGAWAQMTNTAAGVQTALLTSVGGAADSGVNIGLAAMAFIKARAEEEQAQPKEH